MKAGRNVQPAGVEPAVLVNDRPPPVAKADEAAEVLPGLLVVQRDLGVAVNDRQDVLPQQRTVTGSESPERPLDVLPHARTGAQVFESETCQPALAKADDRPAILRKLTRPAPQAVADEASPAGVEVERINVPSQRDQLAVIGNGDPGE